MTSAPRSGATGFAAIEEGKSTTAGVELSLSGGALFATSVSLGGCTGVPAVFACCGKVLGASIAAAGTGFESPGSGTSLMGAVAVPLGPGFGGRRLLTSLEVGAK